MSNIFNQIPLLQEGFNFKPPLARSQMISKAGNYQGKAQQNATQAVMPFHRADPPKNRFPLLRLLCEPSTLEP